MAGESTNTRRRVKLYMLNENRAWDDNGTGHVAVTYSEKPKFMMLDVKSEIDGQSVFFDFVDVRTALASGWKLASKTKVARFLNT